MKSGDDCWLVGRDPKTGKLHLVPCQVVGDGHGGLATVDIRPGCASSSHLVTLDADRVFATREDAASELSRRELARRQRRDAP